MDLSDKKRQTITLERSFDEESYYHVFLEGILQSNKEDLDPIVKDGQISGFVLKYHFRLSDNFVDETTGMPIGGQGMDAWSVWAFPPQGDK